MIGLSAPTLFDKLVADEGGSPLSEGSRGSASSGLDRTPSSAALERRAETDMRAVLLRELDWLLNTTNLQAIQDLSAVPEVATSTLNYGLGDLSGTLLTRAGVSARARDMREAVARFEPRIERRGLVVEPTPDGAGPNSIAYVVRGDLVGSAAAAPFEIRTDVEVDTGVTSVRA